MLAGLEMEAKNHPAWVPSACVGGASALYVGIQAVF
jgi:hypothetical protein